MSYMRHTRQELKSQLELSLASDCATRPHRRLRRSERARWWFDRMHRLVDGATDFKGTNKPPP